MDRIVIIIAAAAILVIVSIGYLLYQSRVSVSTQLVNRKLDPVLAKVLTPATVKNVRVYPPTRTGWCHRETLSLDGDSFDVPPGAEVVAQTWYLGGALRMAFDLVGDVEYADPLTGFSAIVTSSEPSPSGTFFYQTPQGGAANREGVWFDLTEANSEALVVNAEGAPTRDRYLDKRSVVVTRGEVVGFNVLAWVPPNHMVDFHLRLEFGDKAIEIRNGGKEFRVVTSPERADNGYTIAIDEKGSSRVRCRWPDTCYVQFMRPPLT